MIPLSENDLEALNNHPHLSVLTEEYPEIIKEQAREFFGKGLRAGVDFDPNKPSKSRFDFLVSLTGMV